MMSTDYCVFVNAKQLIDLAVREEGVILQYDKPLTVAVFYYS